MRNVLMAVVLSMTVTLFSTWPARAAGRAIPCDTEPMMLSFGDLIACQTDGAGDEDTYQFFNGQVGDLIIVTLASVDTDKLDRRPLATVHSPDGSIIGNLAPKFGSGTELIIQLAQTGVYTIIVEKDGRNARSNYHLGLSRLLSLSPEAAALLFGAGDAAGQISNLGGADVFAFEAVAGTQIEVQLKDNTGNDSLRGGEGDGQLDGGSDADTCDGGTDTDTGVGCERALNIP